ncbi:hypothetical protein CQW23_33324 [Capsicum baccatum]|uniref:Calmodulin-binding domain-containing protein n=1 Tax=Capsicum baccatum TaxID=33114 RepID=A0A2G2V256_CAPBA|nr:hypothetical protein CQW23_33324 [Capsicum baccatum]
MAPLKDQNKMRRDKTNKLNLEMVPEKTLRTPKVKASPKSSSHLQSRPLSNEEVEKEVVKSADSALVVNAAVTQLKNLHGEIDMASNSARSSYRIVNHRLKCIISNERLGFSQLNLNIRSCKPLDQIPF